MKRTALKSGKPLQRKTQLKSGTSTLASVNVKQKAARKIRQAKRYASKEYKAARKEAMARSDSRCEYAVRHFDEQLGVIELRCCELDRLQFHEKRYRKTGGEIQAEDGEILCPYHHALVESKHVTRGRRF